MMASDRRPDQVRLTQPMFIMRGPSRARCLATLRSAWQVRSRAKRDRFDRPELFVVAHGKPLAADLGLDEQRLTVLVASQAVVLPLAERPVAPERRDLAGRRSVATGHRTRRRVMECQVRIVALAHRSALMVRHS